MKLNEVAQAITLQGNIEIKIFDDQGNEKESRLFQDLDNFDCASAHCTDLEGFEVTHMYATKNIFGTHRMVIEVKEAPEA